MRVVSIEMLFESLGKDVISKSLGKKCIFRVRHCSESSSFVSPPPCFLSCHRGSYGVGPLEAGTKAGVKDPPAA